MELNPAGEKIVQARQEEALAAVHESSSQAPTPEISPTVSTEHAKVNHSARLGIMPLERTKAPPTSFNPQEPSWQSWGHRLPL